VELRQSGLESPEVHPPHTHKRRARGRDHGVPRWLELLIAVTALVTSVSSIVIAVHHGKIMERLVQANSIPYMQGGFSNATLAGEEVLSLDLLNRGVGPAHEQSLRVKVNGQHVKSLDELIAVSLGPEQARAAQPSLKALRNTVRTRFVPGGGEQMVFRIVRTAENAQNWDLLASARSGWEVEFCYCSVFHDCWQAGGMWMEPEPVSRCARDEAREFVP
jgi:hypothetical protein